MRSFLLFTLAAPLASFGTVAVGERRPTWDRPSKSQTIGLVASALGITRAEEERQAALARSLGFAVRIDDVGDLLTDYHTTQRPSGPSVRRRIKVGRPIDTRRDELDCDDIETGLSRRELRQGSHYTIALWLRDRAAVTFDDIVKGLQAPCFTLFAGRKANSLMFPCGPCRVEADSVAEAFRAFDEADTPRRRFRDGLVPPWLTAKRNAAARPVYSDDDGPFAATAIDRIEERRDVPDNRAKWRFVRRTEVLLRTPVPKETST